MRVKFTSIYLTFVSNNCSTTLPTLHYFYYFKVFSHEIFLKNKHTIGIYIYMLHYLYRYLFSHVDENSHSPQRYNASFLCVSEDERKQREPRNRGYDLDHSFSSKETPSKGIRRVATSEWDGLIRSSLVSRRTIFFFFPYGRSVADIGNERTENPDVQEKQQTRTCPAIVVNS